MSGDADLLRAFAQELMNAWPEGGIDGGELQDLAERHGLLTITEQTVPCGESCGCSEFFVAGEIADCYRQTPLLTGVQPMTRSDRRLDIGLADESSLRARDRQSQLNREARRRVDARQRRIVRNTVAAVLTAAVVLVVLANMGVLR